jgi:hypothetical protein
MSKDITVSNKGQVLLYQTQDNQTRVDVLLEDETVWLTQGQMAELFQTTKQNVSLHIKNIFSEGELLEATVVKESLTTASDGKTSKTGIVLTKRRNCEGDQGWMGRNHYAK